MPHRAITALRGILRPHLNLSKSQLETLCLMVIGMISARTVNLSHVASERPSEALIASTYRRLQRFFQHVRLAPDWSAPLVIRLLGLKGRWRLALDRTQWKVGAKDVNILMLAVLTPRFRVPLMWSLIEGAGTSDSEARIALMRRYLALFGAASVELLLADREFMGVRWLGFLNESKVPFAVRMKGKLIVTTEDGRALRLDSLLRTCRKKRVFRADLSRDPDHPLTLNVAAKRLKDGELLIVVSNTRPAQHSRPTGSAGPSSACSATPRPAASTSRTRASPIPASSTSCSPSSPSPSPGPGAPLCCSSAAALPSASATAISPSPGSAPASTTSAASCAPILQPPSSPGETSPETHSKCLEFV